MSERLLTAEEVAELLSEWLGRSDKNIEELFDDLYAVARAEVETSAGERLRLPVVVILEEVFDGPELPIEALEGLSEVRTTV